MGILIQIYFTTLAENDPNYLFSSLSVLQEYFLTNKDSLGLMLKLKLQCFGHLMWRTGSLEKTLIMGKIEGRRRRGWLRMRWLDGHEFEQAPGVGDGQGSLACCSPWGGKELDMTEWLNWTELNCSPPGSSVRGILQARILEWVVIRFSREPSWPRDQTCVSCIAGRFFTVWATKEACLTSRTSLVVLLLEESKLRQLVPEVA